MGTRGAYGFRIDGADKITYNHFDSYPSALGKDMIEYVQRHTDAELAEAARRLTAVDEAATPTDEQIAKYASFCDPGVSTGQDWYALLRGGQRNPEAWHQGLDVFADNHAFMADSLFCEFAYVVNLDDGALEFYRGFNKDKDAAGRYAALVRAGDRPSNYFGVRLVEAAPLAVVRDVKVEAVLKRWDKLLRKEDDE